MADETSSIIFGFIATATSIAMFMSPVPMFWRIWKKKTTEDFHPYPYMVSQISFLLCVAYNLVAEMPAFLWYCLLFCSAVVILVIIYAVVVVCFLSFLPFFIHLLHIHKQGDAKPSFIIGSMVVISGTLRYAAPLSNIISVYRTNSSKYMPFARCMTMFLNSIAWFIFSSMKPSLDPYIAITNGVGILLGTVQLGIYYKFHQKSHTTVVKRLEATLDVDPSGEIVVINKLCPRCKGHMFEQHEKLKVNTSMKYVLCKNEGSKCWRVHAVATEPDKFESYQAVPAVWP